MTAVQPLFSGELLASLKDDVLERLDTAVGTADLAELEADPGALYTVVDRVMPKPPVLSRDRVTFEIDETTLSTIDLLSRPRMKDAIAILLRVPFAGDGRFFHLTAAVGFEAHPRGEVEGQQLSLEIVTASTDENDIVAKVAEHLDRVETLLSHQSEEIERWRDAFRRAAAQALADRKARAALAVRTRGALEAAGYRHAATG
ncbi:MAG: hypothetical protein IOB84_08050 [Brevundimonas sp.]|nr:hypothetical protein [Brevundimonas sp.]